MYEVIGYTKENGDVPVQDFLDSLPVKLREKTLRSMLLLEEYGPFLHGEMSSFIGDGVFELRTKFGSDITRVFYFFVIGKRIILTNGFVKKTRKAPKREIDRALAYKKDWEARYGSVEPA